MSHEIKFVSAEDARRQEQRDAQKLSGAAIHPAKVRIDRSGGTGMSIAWRDGHTSSWSFAWLRAACPCATCHEERDAAGRAPGQSKPKPQTLLPMYEAPPRPVDVERVGNYALRFKWNDGHEAGLYSWDYLRNVCDPPRE